MKPFLSVVAVLMILLGTAWLAVPEAMLASWGVQSDPVGVYMSRRYAGLFFGYAAILWLARAAGASAARAAILGGGALVAGLMTLISLFGILTGTISGPAAWGAVVIETVLTGGFLYYFVTERRPAPDKALS